MEAVAKQKIVDWLDQQVAEGKEVSLGWEGGGDSGWVFFEIDGEKEDNEFTNTLVELMYDKLDYGSWAGEFSASGTAIYNPETKCFEGTDYYGEDIDVDYPCSIKLEVPADLWFDSLDYGLEDDSVAHVELSIRNGFLTERHEQAAEIIRESFDDQLDKVIEAFNNDDNYEDFRSVWEDKSIPRSEFVQEGDKLVHVIKTINIGTTQGEEKDICLDLNVFLNAENDNEDGDDN